MRNYNVIFYVFIKKTHIMWNFFKIFVCVFFSESGDITTKVCCNGSLVGWNIRDFYPKQSRSTTLFCCYWNKSWPRNVVNILLHKNVSDRIKEFNCCCFNGRDGRGHI